MKEVKGFVALVDVLGFGHLTDEEVNGIANELEALVDKLLPKMSEDLHDQYAKWLGRPTPRLFGDTIVIAFPMQTDAAIAQSIFYFINDYLGILFCYLLSGGIKLRGCVGYGTVYERKYAIYGSAIVDAKREYEETSWAGIHYTPNATAVIARWCDWAMKNGVNNSRLLDGTNHFLSLTQLYPFVVPYKPDFKGKNTNEKSNWLRFVVPWPKDMRFVIDFQSFVQLRNTSIHYDVHRIFDKDTGIGSQRIAEINRNSLDFFDHYIAKFPDVNVKIDIKGPFPLPE